MYIATFYTTDHADPGLVPVSPVASGDSLDDIIPGLSDALAESLAGSDVAPVNQYGDPVGPSMAEVCQAIHDGTTCIVLDYGEYRDVYSILNI